MLKKLIIGTNSEIVRKIKAKINNADYISHLDIFKTNLNIYKSIFVFSWSHNSLLDNVKLINQLPLKKVIFISTVSVLSLQKRSQWNSYPNNKKKIEKIVLNNRGSVTYDCFDIKKKRLSKNILNKITNEVKSRFKTLVTLEKKETFDSQHVNGGKEIIEKLKIKNLIKSKKIHIVGFPYQIKDNNFYPTKFFIDKEKKGTSE